MQSLVEQLRALEVELHQSNIRCVSERLDALLHASFHEVGRSGRAYDRRTIIDRLITAESHPTVMSSDFEVAELAPGCALLTYRSAHAQSDGSLSNQTLRMSLWVQEAGEWKLRYHQGTPEFAATSLQHPPNH